MVAKDIIGGNMNNYEVALDVPHFEEEKLASSSLILADDIAKLPTQSIGGGMFAIGDTKVRPRLGDKFYTRRKDWASTSRSTTSSRTKRHRSRRERSATRSIKSAPTRSCSNSPKISRNFPTHPANQVTIEKLLPLKNVPPGTYTLKIKAVDKRAQPDPADPVREFYGKLKAPE